MSSAAEGPVDWVCTNRDKIMALGVTLMCVMLFLSGCGESTPMSSALTATPAKEAAEDPDLEFWSYPTEMPQNENQSPTMRIETAFSQDGCYRTVWEDGIIVEETFHPHHRTSTP